jgi:hypothetical protein
MLCELRRRLPARHRVSSRNRLLAFVAFDTYYPDVGLITVRYLFALVSANIFPLLTPLRILKSRLYE